MSVTRRHNLWAVQIDSTLLGGITQQQITLGTEVDNENSNGEVYPRITTLRSQAPRATWTSLAVATALGAVGLTGASIAGLTNKLNLWAQKRAEGGTRAGATSHRKYRANEGIVIPRQLTCEHRGNTQISYEAMITWDGSNLPWVISEDQSLPAGIADTERFGLGPFTLAGILTGQIMRLSIDFGITVEAEGADGDIWPTFAPISEIKPVVTIRGGDLHWFDPAGTLGPTIYGSGPTHVNSKGYLRKKAAAGASHTYSYLPNATAEHIKFTFDGLAYIDTVQDASGGQGSECEIRIPLEYDGTNAPIVFTAASAIT